MTLVIYEGIFLCYDCYKKLSKEGVEGFGIKGYEERRKNELDNIQIYSTDHIPNIENYYSLITENFVINSVGVINYSVNLPGPDGYGSFAIKLDEAKDICSTKIKYKAHDKGANAIIGAKIDYTTLLNTVLMISFSGTPVKIE